MLSTPAVMLLAMGMAMLWLLTTADAQPSPAPKGWAAMADELRRRPDLTAPREAVLAAARQVVTTPLVRRVYHYADLGQSRTWLDGRAKFMDGQPRQEWFGLAMSDFGTSGTLLAELPLLAFAYRCTGEEVFRARIVSQLEETATWSPLQRPGWCLCVPAPDPVPADYWDGSWLATGQGIRALADTLELMPAGSVPPELLDKLHGLLRAEIRTIGDDWRLKRGWFRSGGGVPQTNQWVLPTEGLVRACLVLGKDQFPAEYEQGVANLLRSLDVQGRQGEFNEGVGYAMFTVGPMVAAAHAMGVQGDMRALDHSFLRAFPTWAVAHLQPGRYRVNCFDAGGGRTARNDGGTRDLLSTLAVFANSPVAGWALNTLYDGPTNALIGLLARTAPPSAEAPPLFAAYDGPARRVNWRESWADDASGVWVRGGHPLDGHDHFDRGHVNYIARGKPLLIEAGTPGYDNPAIHTLYSTVVGHNVLDVEGLKPRKAPAPITVDRLDAGGGDLVVDPTPGYSGLERWQRHVTWNLSQLTVADHVALPAGKSAAMTLRWHLGTDQPATITGAAGSWSVTWPEGTLTLTSSVPLQVAAEKLPDATVGLGKKDNGWDHMHTCVIVRTATPTTVWEVKTTVVAAP